MTNLHIPKPYTIPYRQHLFEKGKPPMLKENAQTAATPPIQENDLPTRLELIQGKIKEISGQVSIINDHLFGPMPEGKGEPKKPKERLGLFGRSNGLIRDINSSLDELSSNLNDLEKGILR